MLEIFFAIHDPTTLNRQGNDVGTQYRSGIYFHNAEQERVGARGDGRGQRSCTSGRVVTELLAGAQLHAAPRTTTSTTSRTTRTQGYCAFVVAPKVEKFRKTFAAKVAG